MSIRSFATDQPLSRPRAATPPMAGRCLTRKLARDRRGAVAVEYGFLIALIVIAVLFAIDSLGGANHDIWTNISAKVVAA